MHITRIDHIALDVADRKRSLDWYEQVLGLNPGDQHDNPDEPIFIGPAGARLALFPKRPGGVRHVGLASDAEGQRLLIARLERLEIPYRYERHPQTDSVYFADPDGTVVEVMVTRP